MTDSTDGSFEKALSDGQTPAHRQNAQQNKDLQPCPIATRSDMDREGQTMSSVDGKRVADGQPSQAGLLDWPTGVGAEFMTFAVDRHMIVFYESRPRAEVEAFQFKLISDLLTHAARHSEWWRERLSSARDSKAFDFRRLPLMTRDQFRASMAAAAGPLPLPRGHGTTGKGSTSGSSGTPVSFHYSAMWVRLTGAHYSYDRDRQGVDPSRLFARVKAKMRPHEDAHVRVPAVHVLGRNEMIERRSNQFTIEEHARWVAEVEPGYLFAHASVLIGILDAFEQGIVEPPRKPVDALLSYAETVSPEFRSQARRVLGARVLDRYSCEEVGPLAFQCPIRHDHYHIAMTNALVEVLDENGLRSRPGEIGRIFVTSLHNLATPVVRYELGDLAAWAPRCVCGYDKPVLTRLLGRTRFLIRLPSGHRKYVAFASRHWLSVAPFRETRIVQVSEGVIRAEYVLDRALSAGEEAKLLGILKAEISPDLRYEPTRVERIDWGPTYKRQDVVSLI